MTLQELQSKLEKLFGSNFFQICFYRDHNESHSIGKFWIKIETDTEEGYKVWQIKNCESFEDCFEKLWLNLKKDDKNIQNRQKRSTI